MEVSLRGISAYAWAAPDWSAMRKLIRDAQAQPPSTASATTENVAKPEKYQPASLPRNERRRATEITRLSFRVIEALTENIDVDITQLNAVFASAGGDYDVVHKISTALASTDDKISPTDFHNSVHNAPAGYWSIASQCHGTSTSLSAGDQTFAHGLLEAVMLTESQAQDTLLVAYDTVPPMPLRRARPIAMPFAVALLLAKEPKPDDIARLSLTMQSQASSAQMPEDSALIQQLAQGNPIGRSMPLLRALATQQEHAVLDDVQVSLGYSHDH